MIGTGGVVVMMRQDQTSEVAVPLRNGGTYSPETRPGTCQEGGNANASHIDKTLRYVPLKTSCGTASPSLQAVCMMVNGSIGLGPTSG